jgi:hypothetical protein
MMIDAIDDSDDDRDDDDGYEIEVAHSGNDYYE